LTDNRPIHYFQWHITHACNLRCVHCYQEDYCSHTPEEELFRILDLYSDFVDGRGLRPQINLTGGEPLTHPAFFKLASEIRRRGYRLGILTNGTLIDDDCAKKLAELKPVFVQISLDGTESIHDEIRGQGNFAKAMHGIDLLKKNGVKVLVSFTAQKLNYTCFESLAKECRKHKVDKLWWDRVVTDSKESTEKLALETAQFEELVRTAWRVRRKYRRLNGKSFVSTSRALQAEECSPSTGYICGAGHNLIIVLANGDVMPCRRLPFVIGNVAKETLKDIISGSELMQRLSYPRYPAGCEGCRRFAFCRGGSRCVTYAQTGKLFAKDVNCFYHQKTTTE